MVVIVTDLFAVYTFLPSPGGSSPVIRDLPVRFRPGYIGAASLAVGVGGVAGDDNLDGSLGQHNYVTTFKIRPDSDKLDHDAAASRSMPRILPSNSSSDVTPATSSAAVSSPIPIQPMRRASIATASPSIGQNYFDAIEPETLLPGSPPRTVLTGSGNIGIGMKPFHASTNSSPKSVRRTSNRGRRSRRTSATTQQAFDESLIAVGSDYAAAADQKSSEQLLGFRVVEDHSRWDAENNIGDGAKWTNDELDFHGFEES